jgi:hypothetical protein
MIKLSKGRSKKLTQWTKWTKPAKQAQIIQILAVVVIVAGIGSYLILFSHATNPATSVGADSGTLASGATVQDNSSAADGKYVQFGASTAGTVSSVPDGPSAPIGGWTLDYGDAFNDPICTSTTGSCPAGDDNTWWPNRNSGVCSSVGGDNTQDDPQVFNCDEVSVNSNGLNLDCNYTPGIATPSGYPASNYTCGYLQSVSPVSGEKNFAWKPGGSDTWAFQIVAKFPPNTGEADDSWWSWDPTSKTSGNYGEIDFYEAFGGSAGPGGTWTQANTSTKEASGGYSNGHILLTDPAWIYEGNYTLQAENDFEAYCKALSCQSTYGYLGFDPSAAYHTYTTVIYPNNTMAEYIDGQIQAWEYVPAGGSSYTGAGGTLTGPPSELSSVEQGLVIEYGLRDDTDGDPDPYFTSGTRVYDIRSVSVYENTTANGANAYNKGLAPGTSEK